MSLYIIGKQIAALRKKKGIKQEELAKAVGVSTQAVSKWENGGVPDIELIPKISDFFQVSIDSIFGRTASEYNETRNIIMDDIADTPQEKQIEKVFDYCFDMEIGFFGGIHRDGSRECVPIEEYVKQLKNGNEQRYSSVKYDNGFTCMGLGCKSQYFLLVKDPESTQEAYFEGMDYPEFFKDLSDKDFFNACVLMNKRKHEKSFTSKLLCNKLSITPAKAEEILKLLKKYDMLKTQQIETDDETLTVYSFRPTPSFTALLIFAHEVIKRPRSFAYHYECRSKPYFQDN